MKKIFFLGLAAVAVLASCSKDKTLEVSDSRAISFESFVGMSTKGAADDITNETFNSFQVWGLMSKDGQTGKPFDGTVVTNSGSGWTYGSTQYWEDGYNYSFVAIAPSEAEAWSFNAPSTVGEWGTIDFNNGDGTTDLIYDIDDTYVNQAVETANQCPAAIKFNFSHLLSRVKFSFTNAMEDGSLLNVTDVTITNANTQATATLGATATWALGFNNTTAALAFGNVILAEEATDFAQGAAVETDHKYMIPVLGDGQKYTVTFTITREFAGGLVNTYYHSVELPDITWTAGYSYDFSATIDHTNITGGGEDDPDLCPIQFEAEVTPWEDFEEVPVPGYTAQDGE